MTIQCVDVHQTSHSHFKKDIFWTAVVVSGGGGGGGRGSTGVKLLLHRKMSIHCLDAHQTCHSDCQKNIFWTAVVVCGGDITQGWVLLGFTVTRSHQLRSYII